jgi:hypothetical protein
MARTGRFGRQFREATDLTASIVALYERYERQREEVIFDAWRNGGEFEGKPVTDERLLDFMRDRRSNLDKSDPLWAEWDNRIGQYQFAISDQKNSIAHARAIAAASAIRDPRKRAAAMNAANAGRAAFFRRSATEHPRGSAAYRDLMLKAAQFSRVQQVARASAQKETESERFSRRYYAIYENKIKPAELVIDALELFMVKHGKLTNNEASQRGGLWAMDTQEWGDLHGLLSGLQQDESWPRLRRIIRGFVPGWDGNLDPGDFTRIANVALQGVNEQIRLARAQKGDYRTAIDQAKSQRDLIRRVSVLNRRASIFERYNDAIEKHATDKAEAQGDPFDELAADKAYVDELNRLKRKAMGGADQSPEMLELYAQLDVEVNMVVGNVDGVKTQSAVPLYMAAEGASGGTGRPDFATQVEERARAAKEHRDDVSGLIAGTHVYVPMTGGGISQQQVEPVEGSAPGYQIVEVVLDDITGLPMQGDPSTRIMPMSFSGGSYIDSDGKTVKLNQGAIGAQVTMKPVAGWVYVPSETDPNVGKWELHTIGSVGFHQGVNVWEMFREPLDPIGGGTWSVVGDLPGWVDADLKPYDTGYIMQPMGPLDDAMRQDFVNRLETQESRDAASTLGTFTTPVEQAPEAPTFEAPQGPDAAETFGGTVARAAAGRAPGPGEGVFGGAIGNILGSAGALLGKLAYEEGQTLAGIWGENDAERDVRLAQEREATAAEAASKGYVWDQSWQGRYQASMDGLKIMQDGPLSWGDLVSAYINYDQPTRKTFTNVASSDVVRIASLNGWGDEALIGVANSIDQASQLADETHEAMVLKRMADSDWRIDPQATFDYSETRLNERGDSAWQRFSDRYGLTRPTDLTKATNIEKTPFYDAAQQAQVPNATAMDFSASVASTPSTNIPGLGSMANPVNELSDLPGAPRAPETQDSVPKSLKVPSFGTFNGKDITVPQAFGMGGNVGGGLIGGAPGGRSGGVYQGGAGGIPQEAAQNTAAPKNSYNYNPYNPVFRK